MRDIIRTNDPVLLSFAQALLREAGLATMVADQNMSVMEGSIGILQARLLVADDEWSEAAQILSDAELGQWVRRDGIT